MNQYPCCFGYLVNCMLEYFRVSSRGRSGATHLSDVLKSCGAYFFGRCRRLEIEKRSNIAAHASISNTEGALNQWRLEFSRLGALFSPTKGAFWEVILFSDGKWGLPCLSILA